MPSGATTSRSKCPGRAIALATGFVEVMEALDDAVPM